MNPVHHARQAGFGLVELLIALVLGLIVVGGAVSVFASNRQVFRTTEGLSNLQENARLGFELMTRDIRDAGGTPCSKNIPVANVLVGSAGNWMYDWGNGIQGYEPGNAVAFLPASGVGSRVAGTDAIVLHSGGTAGMSIASVDAPNARITLNTTAHGLNSGDIVLVCDYRQATVTQVTSASPASAEIVHGTGGSTPGNCSRGLGFPTSCATTAGNQYAYAPNSIVARYTSVAWYIGNNLRGRTSLFRKTAGNAPPEEIAEGISNLQIEYLVPGSANYVASTGVGANWGNINAIRIAFTAQSAERVAVGGQRLSRDIVYYAALRNRNQ